MEIDLGHFMIRDWRHGDEEALVRHANNPKIWRNVRDRFPHPYTLDDATWWIDHANSEDPMTSFAIVVGGEAVGGIGFMMQEDIFRRSVEIGYWLGEAFWGRGLVTAAVRAMSRYIFANLDVCRIYAGVFEWNPASMRVLEKAGFTLEGRMRKAATKDGQTIDEFIYALVQEEDC
jgi:[ribosomal protein S5]-alanine N-acetyltransferase